MIWDNFIWKVGSKHLTCKQHKIKTRVGWWEFKKLSSLHSGAGLWPLKASKAHTLGTLATGTSLQLRKIWYSSDTKKFALLIPPLLAHNWGSVWSFDKKYRLHCRNETRLSWIIHSPFTFHFRRHTFLTNGSNWQILGFCLHYLLWTFSLQHHNEPLNPCF